MTLNYVQFITLLNNNSINLFDAESRVVYHRLNNYINQGYDINKLSSTKIKLLIDSLLDNYETRIKYILSLD